MIETPNFTEAYYNEIWDVMLMDAVTIENSVRDLTEREDLYWKLTHNVLRSLYVRHDAPLPVTKVYISALEKMRQDEDWEVM